MTAMAHGHIVVKPAVTDDARLCRGLCRERTTPDSPDSADSFRPSMKESRDLPSRPEMNEFLGNVDGLRDDVERAEARLNLWAARVQKT